jgi:hypothetical protein
VLHDHEAGIARQASGRFRGNVCAVFEHRLAWLLGVREGGSLDRGQALGRFRGNVRALREDQGIDVDDDLVSLARGTGIDPVVKRRLRQQCQRIRLQLTHRRRVHHVLVPARLLIERVAGRGQRLHEQRAGLWLQPPANDRHTVFVLIHVQGAGRAPPRGLARLGDAIHAPPATNDPLDVRGGAGLPHGQQSLLGLRRRHTCQRADLGVRELTARERLGQPRQRTQSSCHADPLAGGAAIEAHSPAEPRRA